MIGIVALDGKSMLANVTAKLMQGLDWLEDWFFAPDTILQITLVVLALVAALVMERLLRPLLWQLIAFIPNVAQVTAYLKPLALPFLWLMLTAGGIAIFGHFERARDVLEPVAQLLTVWLVIRAASLFIHNRDLARLFAIFAWTIAAFKISGILDPTMRLLDSVALDVGKTRVSVWMVLSGLVTFGVVMWIAVFLSKVIEQSINRFPSLTPSAQVLLGKLARWFILTIAFLIAITGLGIDVTALAVIGGALGVGIGFGLQKVVSNLLSGVILLLDRSVKPGDVIEVGETYGWINKLAARYTSVVTRDGREHLIPNEDMVTQTVINWTYSSTKVRQHIPINLSYKSDLKKAMALILEAAAETPRVLADPDPKCLVKAFSLNAIEVELRVWIGDPHNGIRNVASDVLLRVWDKFQEHGIQFPYPQLDLHLQSAEALDSETIANLRALLEKAQAGHAN